MPAQMQMSPVIALAMRPLLSMFGFTRHLLVNSITNWSPALDCISLKRFSHRNIIRGNSWIFPRVSTRSIIRIVPIARIAGK